MSWAGWNFLPVGIDRLVQPLGARAQVMVQTLWARCLMAPDNWLPDEDAYIAGVLGSTVKAWQDLRPKIAWCLDCQDGQLSFRDLERERLHRAWRSANSSCGTPCRMLYAKSAHTVRVRSGKLELERLPGEAALQAMERWLDELEELLTRCREKFAERDARWLAFLAFIGKEPPAPRGKKKITAANAEDQARRLIEAIKARIRYTLQLHLSRAVLARITAAMLAGRCSFTMIAAAILLPEERFLAGWAGPDPPGEPG